MSKAFKGILSVLGSVILALLGFSSCDKIFEFRDEYGSPTVDFKVDITVLDEEGKGIKGIKVIPAKQDGTMELTTDDSGNVQHAYHEPIWVQEKYKVYLEDPDGDLNGGTFARDSAEFATSQTRKGDGNWYMGEWTAKGTKVLKRQ